MPDVHPDSADASNKIEDLSGVSAESFSNPYEALIEACENDPKQIQSRYSTHRTSRNEQQKAKMLSPDFSGLILDPILQKLENPTIEPGYVDLRNCLVFWARPPLRIRNLVGQIQQRLRSVAPNLWLMPLPNLHMTALEVTHSLTGPEITQYVSRLTSSVISTMTDYPSTHPNCLINPLLSYDSAAVAVSFLPSTDDVFTYHHFRRDLFALTQPTGVTIESRYVVPSAHLTIGRFLVNGDHDTKEKMERWIAEIEAANEWLVRKFWQREGPDEDIGENGEFSAEFDEEGRPKNERIEGEGEREIEGGKWTIGEEKGLDLRQGRLWYGGGETVRLGKGI